jgi:hypothetical protein
MKKILLAAFLMVAGLCYGQQPIYNPTAGTLSWTISEDTRQSMTGCIGNNYNAEGQCEGGSETVYHTGQVALSVTNLRTGQTVNSSQTVTGGIATASITIVFQIGDELSYTETQQVYCPITGVWSGISNVFGHFENAFTRADVVAHTPTTNGLWNYTLATYCTVATPDFNSLQTLAENPNQVAFDLLQLMWSSTGHQPWTPITVFPYVSAQYATNPGVAKNCTYNP